MFSIIIISTLFASTFAQFLTCEEVEFCTNIRYNFDPTVTYSLENVEVENQVTGIIVNDQTGESFTFRFVALAGDTFRLTVQDVDNPRYTPEEDTLDGIPSEEVLSLVSNTDDVIVLSSGDNLVVNIYLRPFQIEVLRDGVVIIGVNKANRLIINSGENDQSLALDVSFPLANTAYGIPQHAEKLSLPTTGVNGLSPYRMFNVDNWGYPPFTREALYGSIGVLYGISTDITSGIFWMNAAQTFVDITNEGDGVEALFMSESGALELFLLGGPTLRESVRQYISLTGVTPLPQYFTLGYHQSKYSYMSQEDVETVLAELDNHDFPVDVIWLDSAYTNGCRWFTWNYTAFPNPVEMQNNIAATGRRMVAISDPHIKVEEGYFVYEQGSAGDFFVKNLDGTVYEGECWPGISSYVDYFNPRAQEWYGQLHLLENFPDTTLNLYIWNDMNEPSVFDVTDKTLTPDCVHYNGFLHRDVHNIYGLKQTQATHAGLLERDPTKRPFILTRAHFAGSQRYAAVWTGDNTPSWEHLQVSIPMVLTESLAGMVFSGADVGGFTDNVGEELLQRWYQVGAWLPFYREHSGDNTERREPYLYSEEIQERIRRVLRIRYAHIPYWYTLFFEHQLTGDPIVRPLSYHYPEDESALDIDEQWLIGGDIMAAPVLYEDASTVTTYFPGDETQTWYDVENGLVYFGTETSVIDVDMDSAPYYYRGGSTVVRIDDEVTSTQEQHDLAYTVYFFLDSNFEATGTIYLDDFESFDYRNQIYNYYRINFTSGAITIENLHEDANYDTELTIDQFVVYGAPRSSLDGIRRAERTIVNKRVSIGKLNSPMKFYLY